MEFSFWLRDLFVPPNRQILDAGIKAGDVVLDFGCGPGAYTLAAAEIVGKNGKVYAVDIQLDALRTVQRKAAKKGLLNVEKLRSDGHAIGLESDTVDVALLYDVFHEITARNLVLEELHRVLKPRGILSFSDHHMGEEEIVQELTVSGLFKLLDRGKRTFRFSCV